MKGRDVRCPHCGATCLSSVHPDVELENSSIENGAYLNSYNSFYFLRCDGKPSHDFTFSANEQRAMSQEEGRNAQDKLAREER